MIGSFLLGRRRRTVSLLPNYIILIPLLLFAVGPICTIFFNSLKTTAESRENPLGLPLKAVHWENYPTAWVNGNYATLARNSAVITAGSVAGVLVIAGLAAYSMAVLNLPGANALTLYLLVGSSVPSQLFLVPLFFFWTKLHLTNSLIGLVIIYWGTMSPFATFLLRSYMVSIPPDFKDAARIDGASEVQVLRHIMVPMVWPGFLTAGLTTALSAWNEFLFAVTFLHRDELKPIATGLYAFVSRYTRDWGLTSAASVMMILPSMALFLLFQRQFVEGLTQGGLRM